MLALIALIAALWNAVYNTALDWADGKLSGRLADHRPAAWRVAHALGFEGGLVRVSVPIVVVWTGMSWFAAFSADIGLALAYVVYAYVFNVLYDRVFPIVHDS